MHALHATLRIIGININGSFRLNTKIKNVTNKNRGTRKTIQYTGELFRTNTVGSND